MSICKFFTLLDHNNSRPEGSGRKVDTVQREVVRRNVVTVQREVVRRNVVTFYNIIRGIELTDKMRFKRDFMRFKRRSRLPLYNYTGEMRSLVIREI